MGHGRQPLLFAVRCRAPTGRHRISAGGAVQSRVGRTVRAVENVVCEEQLKNSGFRTPKGDVKNGFQKDRFLWQGITCSLYL